MGRFPKFRFSIDRGGTFTDIYCEVVAEDGSIKSRTLKLLSEDPGNYKDAPTEGIRRCLESVTGRKYIRMGTTVATNALLERKGDRVALFTTRGFGDLQVIGNQSRPKIFDLQIKRSELLYESVVEVDERVILTLYVEQALDEAAVKESLQQVYASGIRSIAVCFLHAYTYALHELKVKELAVALGFTQISISSEVMPMIRAVPRGCTTCVDAYLTPVIKRYLTNFSSGFDAGLRNVQVNFMQSDGGLTPIDSFAGNRAILSGPAGGVVGYAQTAYHDQQQQPVIGFDMGGTSTDVSRYAGQFEHVFETTTAGVTIQSPQLDINTVAAGGGSRLFYRNGLFIVGPESAGAHPGPVCYRKNGHLAVTDANVMLGRVQPHLFPAIFGPTEDQQLDVEGTKAAFRAVTADINRQVLELLYTDDEVAYGFIQVANEAMARPIRNLTTMKGYDHCCAIAKSLGMRKIFVHKHSGILSAYGLSLADVVVEKQEPYSGEPVRDCLAQAQEVLRRLVQAATQELLDQGFTASQIQCTSFFNCRYSGTDTSIMTTIDNNSSSGSGNDDIVEVFTDNYKREYGFELVGRNVLLDDLLQTYFEGGRYSTPVHNMQHLLPGHSIDGPAIIVQDVATVIVEPGCEAYVTSKGNLEILVHTVADRNATEELDPIYLSIFSHRFMGIAEQMGRTLQRTSISVNIKERLDFSCALFDPKGGLVANAPHLPVHLGAMSEAVRYQVKHWGDDLVEGDVLVSNHPQLAGGSHLPDITVITPIFHQGEISFFVASRGHHADVGGIAPGSMPPLSKTLDQEGAAIVAFKLVRDGVFQEEGIVELLQAPGDLPGNFGTRNLSDNLSDLKAQVAANNRGAALMHELVAWYGLSVVTAYMQHIQDCAEQSVRGMLRQFSIDQGLEEVDSVSAEDFLDDGSPIRLRIHIDRRDGSARFDFAGTGHEIYGNLNAPPAVTTSAVIYCLRCLVPDADIPLNQGCLTPITIDVPKNSLLRPSDGAAVVGGNVLTSQRVTDVVLKAFQACAASQGCMNNLTFGDESMGYYETIAEILERRYPVILRKFSLRSGSGGAGQFSGGDGVVRELEFRQPLVMSILSERRAFKPYGMAGGNPAQCGVNTLIVEGGCMINLGGKNTVNVTAGNRLLIETPGGGGYGPIGADTGGDSSKKAVAETLQRQGGGSLAQYSAMQETA
eukprot:GSChrysophyteH2.ASY1.ANO1.1022.1 assembled CDS